ncbi:MAG: hypothetical protein AAGC57_20265 [Pseudomonadota bacterium]
MDQDDLVRTERARTELTHRHISKRRKCLFYRSIVVLVCEKVCIEGETAATDKASNLVRCDLGAIKDGRDRLADTHLDRDTAVRRKERLGLASEIRKVQERSNRDNVEASKRRAGVVRLWRARCPENGPPTDRFELVKTVETDACTLLTMKDTAAIHVQPYADMIRKTLVPQLDNVTVARAFGLAPGAPRRNDGPGRFPRPKA